ncbi:peptidase, S8/S53 family [Actinomyces sp. ICM58]|uniref:S8 family serine peptidase n=1 Tax=Actinomyces sp. ICM58 TaxID=1105030 RepID=UPI0002772629|nr:S8 family serine peptidase [Actinomyces sp. ICM58]EJN51137.1 peptidase, S8/S53 family [Actinomyces sp. ICM58]
MTHRPPSALALSLALSLAATTLAAPAALATGGGVGPVPGATQPAPATPARPASSSDTPTTIIVQLEDGTVAIPRSRRAFGLSTQNTHDEMRARIAAAVEGVVPGAKVTTVRDYTHALDGFAIEAPASALSTIQQVEGVKAAFIEGTHKPMGSTAEGSGAPVLANASSLAMTRANQATQKGDGQVIEIIDSGLQTDHDAFSGSMDGVAVRMSQADAQALTGILPHGGAGTYLNSKIPFAYDYADNDANVVPTSTKDMSHGTHVAAIAAANGGEVRGTAPNAQIIVAKVVHDADGVMDDSALLAALDDALVIKPDVINISLGDDAGMSSDAGSIFAGVYEKLTDAGITVNAAAGNAFSNAYGNNSGQNKPFATDPDTGTLGEPASYQSTLAVASVDNQEALSYVSLNDRTIAYRTALDGQGQAVPGLRDIPEKSYRVVDAGAGGGDELDKYAGTNRLSLADAIVLEDKGGTDTRTGTAMTDELKASYLTGFPSTPAALMIADTDESDTPYQSILGATTTMPTVTITKKDGEAIRQALSAAGGADVYLSVTHSGIVLASNNPTASEFSAWGVTPDLRLKPEIAAPGGDIMSAYLGNQYQRLSGTSMASPQVAGISALVRQRLAADPAFSAVSATDKNALVTNLLMGTAHPLIDVEAGDGTYYSPRKVGAGAVDALAATTAAVYPSVVGAADPSRPKADLGDGTTGWTFQVRLTNLSDAAHTYTLGGQALSEMVEEGLFAEHSQNWAGQGISLTFTGDSLAEAGGTQQVTVPAASTATVSVTVTPEAEFAAFAAQNTPQGTFIDGAVTFTSGDETPSLTVPYLGFYGSWGAPSVFDGKWSDNETTPVHVYRSALVNAHSSIPLGSLNPMSEQQDLTAVTTINTQRLIMSRAPWAQAPNTVLPMTGMLRSVPSMTLTYRNSAGQSVRSYTINRVRKSLYDLESGWTKPGEFSGEDPVFDGYDQSGNALPDGRYTLTIEAATDGPSSRKHQMSYEFTLDTQAPVISNLNVSGEGDARTVSFDVTDASPVAAIDFSESPDSVYYFRKLVEDDGQIQADGTHRYHFDIPVSELTAAWAQEGRTDEAPAAPYLFAWDWGTNRAVQEVRLQGDPTPAPEPAPTPQGGQWVSDSVGWWYRYVDGTYPVSQTVQIGNSTYRFGADGYMRTGWVNEDGAWYYYDASGAQASGWVKDGSSWYYLDPATGQMVTGWILDGPTWYYLTPGSGAMATGWVKDGSAWYYMAPSGALTTGWVKDGGSWYYLSTDSGAMMKGWLQVGDSWYYLTPGSGAMATGWLKDGGSWYYLSTDSGVMYTGGHWIGWTWYRFADSGQWLS